MPNISVDSTLSVYGLLSRVTDAQQSLVNHRRTMNMISNEIENAILQDGVAGRVFAGFQLFSRFMPQFARYEKMAKTSESIYIFGIPDMTPPAVPNIHYVPLPPTAQLAREWFVIVEANDYFTILATEEIGPTDVPDPERKFKGIWTFNEDLTTILQEWLSSLVDARKLDFGNGARDYKRQIVLLSKTMSRLTMRMTRLVEKQASGTPIIVPELQAEIQAAASSIEKRSMPDRSGR